MSRYILAIEGQEEYVPIPESSKSWCNIIVPLFVIDPLLSDPERSRKVG